MNVSNEVREAAFAFREALQSGDQDAQAAALSVIRAEVNFENERDVQEFALRVAADTMSRA